MEQIISIILARSSTCPHCIDFEPIYEKAKNIYKLNKFLSKHNIKFEDYNLADNNVRNTFYINHNDVKDKIQWYPTIFVNIRDTQDKNKITNDYLTIEHTVVNTKLDNSKQIEEAAQRFLENIINVLKTSESDNKVSFIQTGGISNYSNANYKNKYLKYKTKYLELKNKNIF